MRLLTRQLQNDHNIFLFSCDHEGTVLRSKKGWDKLVHMMNSSYGGLTPDRNWGIHHGDIMEAIMIDDPRYNPLVIPEDSAVPLEQAKNCVKNLEPIKEKLLTVLEGNHPLKLSRFGLLTKWVCDQLLIDTPRGKEPVPYGTWSSKITIETTGKAKLMYKIHSTHGRKSIISTADDPKRRRTNKELILKRLLKFKMSDCALMSRGHSHLLLCCRPEKELIIVGSEKLKADYTGGGLHEYFIHPDHRWYVSAGSFQMLYGENISGYAEIGEYDPIEIGFAVARIRDRKIVDADLITLDI